jgi:hypothetical protein
MDSVGSGQGLVAGSCEHGDEPAGSGATELVTPSRVPRTSPLLQVAVTASHSLPLTIDSEHHYDRIYIGAFFRWQLTRTVDLCKRSSAELLNKLADFQEH